MVEWELGKAWTHPSIQRLSTEEMREKLNEAYQTQDDDHREFGRDPRPEAKELLRADLERIDTLCIAIEQREEL